MLDLGHFSLGVLLLTSLLTNLYLVRRNQIRQIDPSQRDPSPPTPSTLPKPSSETPNRSESSSATIGAHGSIDVSALARFVHVHDDISNEIEFLRGASQQCDSLQEILLLFTQALNDCGVEEFSPSIGESYRTAFGVAPNPVLIKTTNSDEAWKIAEVTAPGFCMGSPQQCCIKEAVVVVYKFQPED